MEQRKVEVLERMSALTGLGTGTNDTGVAAVTDHQTAHQAEIARFAEKIAAICTAKLVSDTKLANLTGALKNMKGGCKLLIRLIHLWSLFALLHLLVIRNVNA